jgi:AcrR family transcriptional regulator
MALAKNMVQMKNKKSADRTRMSPSQRKESLVTAAARIVEEQGVDALRIPSVAQAVGVSRPVVYAHFKNRQEILIAILEDYQSDLEARFKKALNQTALDLESAVEAVLCATCEAIEAKGTGAWNLLGAKGPDPVIEQRAQRIRNRLRRPWAERIRKTTKAGKADVLALTHLTGTVTRGVIDLWISGKLKKHEAIRVGITSVTAMLRAFRGQKQIR